MLNFDELLQKVKKESGNSLETMRRNIAICRILIVVALLIMLLLLSTSSSGTKIYIGNISVSSNTLYIIAIIFVLYFKKNKKYTTHYKENVIATFIKAIDENLNYQPVVDNSTRLMNIYYTAEFDKKHPNRIHIDDLVTGNIDGFSMEMCDMDLQRVTGAGRNRHVEYIFQGQFIQLYTNKNINGYIKITTQDIFTRKAERVKLDDVEFEKKFDVQSTNRELSMQYLTPDVMQLITDFRKHSAKFEFFWSGSRVLIRIKGGNIFEAPSVFSRIFSNKSVRMLRKYFEIFGLILTLNKIISTTIKETHI